MTETYEPSEPPDHIEPAERGDDDYVHPENSGCYICHRRSHNLLFSMEFDCWYHEDCLPEDCGTLKEYITS